MRNMCRKNFTKLLATCVLAGVASFAMAQNKTTKILVAFPPGGPVDFVARTLTEQLSKELGQTVVVENKAGANGAIAADALIKAPADGQTLWLTSVGASDHIRVPNTPSTTKTTIKMASGRLILRRPRKRTTGSRPRAIKIEAKT